MCRHGAGAWAGAAADPATQRLWLDRLAWGASTRSAEDLADMGLPKWIGVAAWRKTEMVVISEFGRTFRENGNKGTDHGHGAVYWVLRGGLSSTAGGCVVGDQAEVSQKTLFQNRYFSVLNEYRAVFGGLFRRMYGLSPAQPAQVFQGVAPQDLQLI